MYRKNCLLQIGVTFLAFTAKIYNTFAGEENKNRLSHYILLTTLPSELQEMPFLVHCI